MKNINISSKLMIAFFLSAIIIFATAAISLNSIEKIASAKTLIYHDENSHLQEKQLKDKSLELILRQSRLTIIISSITGFLICISLGFLTARSISIPLVLIQKKMEELAQGKIPDQIILDEDFSKNEILNIVKSLNKIISSKKQVQGN